MKRVGCLLGALLLLSVNAGIADAYTINYLHALGDGGLTSPYAGVQVETFDTNTPLWSWAGNGQIINNSISGQAAAPFGDTTYFVSVPQNIANSPLSYTATGTSNLTGGTFNYFGLWWGSVDDYNTITFLLDNSAVATVTGSQAIDPGEANGNQQAPSTNLYVNFLDLPDFNGFMLTSTKYAFEADNIAVGNVVPEPGTILLLGGGLLGLAFYGRKRMKA